MGKFFFGILVFAGLAGFLFYKYFYNGTIFSTGTINFTVQEFGRGELIPQKFTCDGADISPSYLIERVPQDAKSLVLIVDDPDATPETFTHFIMFNIDPDIGSIDQGITPSGVTVATNDFGKKEYNGPCPPIGTHEYFYRIYALDTQLLLTDEAKRSDIDNAVKGHVIAKGEYTGSYIKN